MRATWLADVLRAANVPVVELLDWNTRGNGELIAVTACVWHHDGSGIGDSPNIPDYIRRQVDAGMPGANCWVGLDGTWHLIAAGRTYHAGAVLAGKPNNSHSIGIETDHTTGETWSGVALLDSLRRGTAAILAHLGIGPATGLEFHKTICAPPGRKNDPDGLTLATERAAVAQIMAPPIHSVPPAPVTFEEDTVFCFRNPADQKVWLVEGGRRSHIERPALNAYIHAGVLEEPSKNVTQDDANILLFAYPEK